ncbi:Uncharacterized protein DBV15_04117 [Temnothorax longispinosus]|uniref:Uncharacterized protein n=1 Tax=Temnothorax longispinosus TaxID=300112 RepID=A0A4S2KC67_9HYME|nr:Uncharacterized protein DBV15_04117 [Temnothorax longispinosus]
MSLDESETNGESMPPFASTHPRCRSRATVASRFFVVATIARVTVIVSENLPRASSAARWNVPYTTTLNVSPASRRGPS